MSLTSSLRNAQVFLGILLNYQQLIPQFSELAKTLVQLLQNNLPFSWGDKKTGAFSALCEALKSSPILVHHNFKIPFILFTDISNVAIGAILFQRDLDGVDYLISYYSKTLSKLERN